MISIPVPDDVGRLFDVHEWRNALAVLSAAQPKEWSDICAVLGGFRLLRSEILAPGGGKSRISSKLDSAFNHLGWVEKKFNTSVTVDDDTYETPTHKVDCFKNRVALEIE